MTQHQPPAGAMIMVDGVRLRYVDQGQGPAILLVHGFPSSIEASFGRLLPLMPSSYRVIAVDLAGLGYSDRARDSNLGVRAQARRLVALLAQLGVERATVVGTSMGGAVAQHLVLTAPERVERLVLLASLDASVRPPGMRRVAWATSGIILGCRLPVVGRRLREALLRPHCGFDATWTKATARQVTTYAFLPGTASAVRRIIRDSLRDPTPDLATITVPTVVVSGAQDTVVPPSVGAGIAATIVGARHIVWPDCTHGLALHYPRLVADLLVAELGMAPPT